MSTYDRHLAGKARRFNHESLERAFYRGQRRRDALIQRRKRAQQRKLNSGERA